MATVGGFAAAVDAHYQNDAGSVPFRRQQGFHPSQSAVDGVDKNVRAGRLFADRLPDFVNQRLRGGDADIADNQTVTPLVPVLSRRRRHPLSRAQQAGEDIGHGKGSAIEPKVAPSDIAGLSVGMQDL